MNINNIKNFNEKKNQTCAAGGPPVSKEVFGCVKYRCYLYITAKKFIPLKKSHSRDISI